MKCAEASRVPARPPAGHPSRSMMDFSKLGTPPRHGDVLIEPNADRLVELAESNRKLICDYPFMVLGLSVAEIRSRLRERMCDGCTGPVIMTGHQPEFIHAGVWAKHVVASALAKAMGSKAVNLVVDSDAPGSTTLAVPDVSGESLRWRSVAYASLGHGVSHDAIGRMDEAAVDDLSQRVAELMGDRYASSQLPGYFEAIRAADGAADWVDQMVSARQAIERRFGVEMREHRVGRVWGMPLLPDLMVHAERFATAYNGALADYRVRFGERSATRPVPDLQVDGGRVELPVWVYRLGEARRRLFVSVEGERIGLFGDDERIGEVGTSDLATWESAEAVLGQIDGYLFRPRALGLTLWARVFAGDLFIHGIGGAKYDRVTDEIVRRYFSVEPAAMACVSATMWFEGAGNGADGSEVERAVRRLRDVRWNPQRHVANTDDVRILTSEREAAVAESQRLRAVRSRDRVARRGVFQRIREINERLRSMEPTLVADAEADVVRAREEAADVEARTNREFFFGMLKTSALEELRDQLTQSSVFRV